ncbi:MAG: N-formylglutamate amidohydrolase [Nitrospiraceae bacterium]|nr:MAG: N-formylglutamate amidohydrolase [Nitrospiraceae bacterium]
MRNRPVEYLITCEHGGSAIPREYSRLFRNRQGLLASHRGYDRGSRDLAGRLAERLGGRLYYAETSRLLVDLNRSPGHPRLFSEITRYLAGEEKATLLLTYYHPYRNAVRSFISGCIGEGRGVVHVSVHTFTPVLGGVRNADAGLLYDPSRDAERELCLAWQEALSTVMPWIRVRRNYPYRGKSDGMVSSMRKRFGPRHYLGVELELNQRHVREGRSSWKRLQDLIGQGAEEALSALELTR